MMKNKTLSLLVMSLASALTIAAKAGNMSSGGDNATAFACASPKNVDSALRVIGFDYQGDGNIDLKIWVGTALVAQDSGVLNRASDQYTGKAFTIELNSDHKSPAARIIATKANPVLQVGRSEVLNCKASTTSSAE
jgi:hypothetical protein